MFLLAAGSALAQFQDLATPDDGSLLFFSSSLRLNRQTQSLDPKLFLMDPTGIHLYAQQAAGDSIGHTTANFYQLAAPDVSADGRVVAYTARRPCAGGSGCLPVERFQGHIAGLPGQPEPTFAGHVRISRNAAYAIAFGSSVQFNNPGTRLIELQTGKTTSIPAGYDVGSGRRRTALDGTVAVVSGTKLALWRKSGVQTLNNSQPPAECMLNDAATLVVYETSANPSSLIVYEIKSSHETTLASGAGSFRATMSGDGSSIAYLKDGHAWIVRSDGTGTRPLLSDPAGVTEAMLAGNGQVLYAITGAGRMLRVDVGSDTVTELVPRTPNVDAVDQPVPGSLVRITGTGLADDNAVGLSPLSGDLGGVQIKLGGVPMPLALIAPTEIRWQVPWEWPAGDAPFQLLSGTSPFEGSPDTLTVNELSPRYYGGTDTLLAVHSRWDALVSEQNPAQPGEVLHVYLGGSGPVTPSVPTGLPAPADLLARVVILPRCQFWDGGPNGSEVLYAGLAPGMVGIYQMELRVPSGLRVTPVSVICDYGPDSSVLGASGLLPVAVTAH